MGKPKLKKPNLTRFIKVYKRPKVIKLYNTDLLGTQKLGIVSGCYVASKFFVRDFFAGIRTLFGWEVKEYSEMMNDARAKAIERMVAQAEQMGATAIVNVRFSSAYVGPNMAEILAYGTAVKEKK